MKSRNSVQPTVKRLNHILLIASLVIVAAVVTVPFYSAQSSSLTRSLATSSGNSRQAAKPSRVSSLLSSSATIRSFSLAPVPTQAAENIQTFASDCVTPRTNFILGETVCAVTTDVTESDRFVNWCVNCPTVDHGGQGVTDITTSPQSFLYTPTVSGTWKATIASSTDSAIVSAVFTVGPQTATIMTYEPGCVTPKTSFTLGDVVCAKAIGVSGFRFSWVDPGGFVEQTTAITTDPQTDSYTLPTATTTIIQDITVQNVGNWRVNVITNRGSVRASAFFSVQDAAQANADLFIYLSAVTDTPTAGSQVQYTVDIINNGPNNATAVNFKDETFVNATFDSVTQTSGPAFTCSGSGIADCSIANFAAGAKASFLLSFTAGSAGSTIDNKATVASTTNDPNPADNESTARSILIGTGGSPTDCVLECPNNMTLSANTTQAGQPGTFATFASAEAFGSCGTVTMNPASGSFFPVGSTVVQATSSSGSGSCSFTITVVDTPAPTITCQGNLTQAADPGESEATVPVDNPTYTGNNAVLTGVRSDNRPTTDPYPIGTTRITWTVKECNDPPQCDDPNIRTASCTQDVTVTSTDAPTISCPSNKSFTSPDGCTYTATASEIGTPTTTGAPSSSGEPCPLSNPCAVRSDGLALTDPFPAGQTAITWTATNDVGSASCTQIITVTGNDNEPPTLQVPPSITTSTDQCSVLLDDEQFVATAEDNCSSSVNISRTGMPQIACPVPGNPGRTCDSFVFPTGTTVITYTATDSAGNSTSGTQTVTVNENPNINPTIDAPGSLTVNTGPGATSCGTFVGDATLGTATANDNCPGFVVTRSGVPAGNNFPVGTTTITYTVTDRVGNTAQDTQTVTVIDDTPPVITCPANITQNTDPGVCFATVNPGTATATDNCDSNPTIVGTRSDSLPLNAPYPKGTTTITWTATDHATPTNNQSSCQQTITVEDHEAPVITTNGVTPSLWPANHAYHTFNVTNFVTAVSDNCDVLTVSNVVIEKVTSDESENGGGDGNTFNDIIIAADCKSVQVRAERRNSGDGRVYTIHFKVTDLSGNVGTKTATIHSPKNLGNHTVDSGPNYTVNGTCP